MVGVLRSVRGRWFERNKHIFPASRWETYDPAVQRERYTIHGGEVRGKVRAGLMWMKRNNVSFKALCSTQLWEWAARSLIWLAV